jgi:hypothetical protein
MKSWPLACWCVFSAGSAVAGHTDGVWGEDPGALVTVSIEVEGRSAPLYAAVDGSNRWYLEAREGSRYAVRLQNRTAERVGVVLTVDGLNAISGERQAGTGRMYVLDPWDSAVVQGWRTSLDSVRRFTFVDERASYAVRSGKLNAKMGWIEAAVYRERRPFVRRRYDDRITSGPREEAPYGESHADGRGSPASPLPEREGERDGAAPPEAMAGRPAPPSVQAQPEKRSRDRAAGRRESYPGTGWGTEAEDHAVVVSFEPEPHPSDVVTVRYEYARALRALGVMPRPWWSRDRLRDRERGASGFAQPPRY